MCLYMRLDDQPPLSMISDFRAKEHEGKEGARLHRGDDDDDGGRGRHYLRGGHGGGVKLFLARHN